MREIVRAYRVNLDIRQAATNTIFLTPERDELSEVHALFSLVRDSVRYVRDVHDVETISSPDVTLAGRVGDCDDQTVLLASLLESVGYQTRFVVAGYSEPGALEHVYLQVLAAGDWINCDATEQGQPLGWAPPGAVCLYIERV
ncbi:MAG: transglutaminase domain-containing protein [Xanthomonadales bacterium]|nr:transglutaminase domain-containing protein [Xanthomonadales bacterium]